MRLGAADRARILAHLLKLDGDDRILRFSHAVRDDAIARYVAAIDFARDHVLGVEAASGELAALGHVGVRQRHAEFGLSVHPGYRQRGLGWTLFRGVLDLCSAVGASVVTCHTLSPAVIHMAAAAGFRRAQGAPAAELVLDLPALAATAGTAG